MIFKLHTAYPVFLHSGLKERESERFENEVSAGEGARLNNKCNNYPHIACFRKN